MNSVGADIELVPLFGVSLSNSSNKYHSAVASWLIPVAVLRADRVRNKATLYLSSRAKVVTQVINTTRP
jgi:hypothetical protein